MSTGKVGRSPRIQECYRARGEKSLGVEEFALATKQLSLNESGGARRRQPLLIKAFERSGGRSDVKDWYPGGEKVEARWQ